jgi:transcriptional regulator with XRE-family HTH domain
MAKKGLRIFPKRLRQARETRDLSQQELAQRTGLQQPVVSLYESGSRRPSFRNLGRLADALEVATDYLIGRAKSPGLQPQADGAMLRNYQKLTATDREVVRGLIAQLAKRNRSGSRRSA